MVAWVILWPPPVGQDLARCREYKEFLSATFSVRAWIQYCPSQRHSVYLWHATPLTASISGPLGEESEGENLSGKSDGTVCVKEMGKCSRKTPSKQNTQGKKSCFLFASSQKNWDKKIKGLSIEMHFLLATRKIFPFLDTNVAMARIKHTIIKIQVIINSKSSLCFLIGSHLFMVINMHSRPNVQSWIF